MPKTDLVIETRDLHKRFGTVHALAGLDVCVPAGSIYGFLGRNGAGKTTTIKALIGMVKPTSGEGRVLGCRIDDERDLVSIRRRTGFVGEDRRVWSGMTASEVLAISRRFFPAWRVDVEQEYLDAFEIPRQQRVNSFSKGTRTAFALVLALARGAELLLLDEPTDGLDPAMNERALQALVRAASENPSLTIFFSSHRLDDVPAYVAVGAIVLLGGLVTFMIRDVTPYSFFRLMNGADYFFARQMPWTGLVISVGAGSALIWGSLQLVEHKDY